MKTLRRRRLYAIIFLVIGASLATCLAIYALGQNMNLYFTPSQIAKGEAPHEHVFRAGGMVVPGSVKRQANSLTVSFILTDYTHQTAVTYTGILPALFREGQGIVVEGKLNSHGVIVANQVLAKHDEKYMPPNIKREQKANNAYGIMK
ncbi:MAG: cytochrome c maturation protein CcmE [Candidatus Nitrosotenuis sp.]